MAKKKPQGRATRSIHAGEDRPRWAHSLTTPIALTSTYVFEDSGHIEDYTSGKRWHCEYGRYHNPTRQVAEARLADLEGAEDAVLFDCGMSAVSTALLAFLKAGDHIIITDDAYKRTLSLCTKLFPRFGVDVDVISFGDYAGMASKVRKETRLIFSESPTNPYLNIMDLEKIRQIAKSRKGLTTFIDSTFATPANQRPLESGMDVVIHSATKYLGGHNDILCGVVLGSRKNMDQVRDLQRTMGGIPDPLTCYLLIRGLKTFGMRMERLNGCGYSVAEFLESHPRVRKVYYPGLKSHRHHALAKKYMRGFGAVVTFEIDGNLADAKRFLDRLKLCQIGPSLGGVETLVTHPGLISYYDMNPKQRKALGILDELVRLSCGLEDPEDIMEDLDQALEGSSAPRRKKGSARSKHGS